MDILKPCASDKIMNPKTKRCIKIGTQLFKKLLQDKTLTFSVEDIK